ncbi:hypothetical protein [Diaphorobacter aerolatus]|uniref:Uncharacterized protein n=1 Tax=Diaphorobacter aerolatus TaxID=1288495 RepID=A0A7H0GHY7_9BURK|nr:hypothetical protein [Diaphorobacter aerolatus]QNP47903.1 hypothetical protein H9K75_17525 [Diaphorobacter aerolatus]
MQTNVDRRKRMRVRSYESAVGNARNHGHEIVTGSDNHASFPSGAIVLADGGTGVAFMVGAAFLGCWFFQTPGSAPQLRLGEIS